MSCSLAISAPSVFLNATHRWCIGAQSARPLVTAPRRGFSGAPPLVRLRARVRASCLHFRGSARVAWLSRAAATPLQHYSSSTRPLYAPQVHRSASSAPSRHSPLCGCYRASPLARQPLLYEAVRFSPLHINSPEAEQALLGFRKLQALCRRRLLIRRAQRMHGWVPSSPPARSSVHQSSTSDITSSSRAERSPEGHQGQTRRVAPAVRVSRTLSR